MFQKNIQLLRKSERSVLIAKRKFYQSKKGPDSNHDHAIKTSCLQTHMNMPIKSS